MKEEVVKKEINISAIRKSLKKKLSKERFQHTIGVEHIAIALAMCHGADLEKAQLAGLLHDCAKYMKDQKYLKVAKEANLLVSEIQVANPSLLHGTIGAYFAQTQYGIKDEEILNSIRNHTCGRSNMSLLEKIIYVADYIEPGRDRAPRLDEIRALAFHDLNRAIYWISYDTLEYLKESNKSIDIDAYDTLEFYKKYD